ncbi:hypothetical protein FFLO_00938 [Filobasidium floriforme]|uniref:Protein phosphatase n=1 Tax=Filobasidium floriforme TaxID=5210 RepID=A0A8K0JVG8_9TREE|nr:hypothetical protein FFLO_00938 [Filobasidium floriforme]
MSLRSVQLVTPRLFTRTRIAAFSTCTRRFESHSTSDPLRFSVGVGYSGKDTPPFVSRERANEAAKKGFQPDSKIGRWKREMMALGGGRVELFDTMQESKEDDWTRENSGLADRRRWGSGEDSFFVNESVSRKTYLAVQDGVGGWSDAGVDPSLFSESLTYHMYTSTLKNPSAKPVDVLIKGYAGVLADEGVKCGSSTSCVVSLDKGRGLLEAANLGDSGFTIIRNGAVHFASTSQTVYFNCPWQLAKLVNKTPDAASNRPEQADLYQQALKPGDMIVLYTDGFSDNVHPHQLVGLLKHVDNTLASPENAFLDPLEREVERARLLADVLVAYGRMVMGREDVQTPFELEAAQNRLKWPGGKLDDITVLTVHVGQD